MLHTGRCWCIRPNRRHLRVRFCWVNETLCHPIEFDLLPFIYLFIYFQVALHHLRSLAMMGFEIRLIITWPRSIDAKFQFGIALRCNLRPSIARFEKAYQENFTNFCSKQIRESPYLGQSERIASLLAASL